MFSVNSVDVDRLPPQRLQVLWERAGLLAKAEPHLPAIGRVVGPGLKRVRGLMR
jgi:hypothetical protein